MYLLTRYLLADLKKKGNWQLFFLKILASGGELPHKAGRVSSDNRLRNYGTKKGTTLQRTIVRQVYVQIR